MTDQYRWDSVIEANDLSVCFCYEDNSESHRIPIANMMLIDGDHWINGGIIDFGNVPKSGLVVATGFYRTSDGQLLSKVELTAQKYVNVYPKYGGADNFQFDIGMIRLSRVQ